MRKATKLITSKFKEVSASEKRILIAKDVIRHVKTEEYRIRKGVYLDLPKKLFSATNANRKIQSLFGKIESCRVCALGSIFMSKCNIADGQLLGYNDMYSGDYGFFYNTLGKYFSLSQLMLIEAAFETDLSINSLDKFYSDQEKVSHKKMDAAVAFGEKYNKASIRLEAIMENLIKNKGTFKPTV